MAPPLAVETVVLVEGESDRVALLTLAERRGHDLAAEGIAIQPMAGIHNLPRHLASAAEAGVEVCGLYDAGEERIVRSALDGAGLIGDEDPTDVGFFRCDADLEDEFIRALGAEGVRAVIAAAGEDRSLSLLRGMPAQREWTEERVLHRFLGSQGGRKARYARLFAEVVPLAAFPPPLVAVLDWATREPSGPRGGRSEPTR